MSIAVGKSGGFWEIRYEDGETLPTRTTSGYEDMPDKSAALNTDTGEVSFYSATTSTWKPMA